MDEEEKKIRHTISAEETFTLAKDIFDIRTFIKNAYANRAVIARRINVITLCVSIFYTLLYASYALYKALGNRITLAQEVFVYASIGVYVAVLAGLIIITVLSARATTKNLRRFSLSLKIMRFIIKLLSIVMAIFAIVISVKSGGSNAQIALDIVVLVLSIISMVILSLPMFFGGIGKFVRWLLSPVKAKHRFSAVAMEWYELAVTGKPTKGASTKVAKKHYDTIDRLIDVTLVPALGQKYINTIKPVTLIDLVENSPQEDKPVLEGVLKSIFAYAAECGYVAFNPCRDLNFEGTIEVEKKKTIKQRFMGLGTRIGKKVLDKYIDSTAIEDDVD